MEKLKILDFDYGCGGFTKGLEESGLFEVVYNGSINEMNSYCYNKTHFNNFKSTDLMPKDVDLVVFTPNLGQKLSYRGFNNFVQSQLDNFTVLSHLNGFDNIIFVTQRDSYPFLQSFGEVLYTTDGFPTKDVISCRFLDLGYFVFNFMLDGAGFGLPQHKFYNIYWISKDIDKSIFIKEGFGRYKRRYRVVKNLIGDIDDNSSLSWHKPDYKKRFECSKVLPGGSAKDTEDLFQSQGYIRLDADKLAPSLSYDFYRVSGKGPSINPWFDRPLTIREGARLFGLTDDFAWDYSLKNRDVAMMIYESFPPVISELMSRKIARFIKKNE